jgi:hypothetical protein
VTGVGGQPPPLCPNRVIGKGRPASRLDKNERREDSDVQAKVNRAARRGRSQVPSATVGTEELPCDVFHSVVFLLLPLAGKFRAYILGRVGVRVKEAS